jgi:hypothetical protein
MFSCSNAITDRRVIPYPDTPPDPGCAGTLIVDPFCGNTLVRITDAETNVDFPGRPFTTPSSGEAQPWAADSSAFFAIDAAGGRYWLFAFDPKTLTAELVQALPFDAAEFSHRHPAIIWGNAGLLLQRLNLGWNVQTICDLADSALPIPDSPAWYINALSVDWFDARLAFNLGPQQDVNSLVVVSDSRLGLCWLDTSTGRFDGWATGTIEPWTPFTIHNTRLAKSGHLVKITPSGLPYNSMAFWTPGTSQFALVEQSSDHSPFTGHQALGFATYYGAVQKTCWCQWIAMPFWKWVDGWRDLQNPVPNTAPAWADYHLSVQPDSADRNPLFASSYDGNVKEPGAPLTEEPCINEILAMATDGSGAFWRLAHTYASGVQGFYSTPRGNVSPDGKFFVFTSDWQQTLGPGRSDVFVLKV